MGRGLCRAGEQRRHVLGAAVLMLARLRVAAVRLLSTLRRWQLSRCTLRSTFTACCWVALRRTQRFVFWNRISTDLDQVLCCGNEVHKGVALLHELAVLQHVIAFVRKEQYQQHILLS